MLRPPAVMSGSRSGCARANTCGQRGRRCRGAWEVTGLCGAGRKSAGPAHPSRFNSVGADARVWIRLVDPPLEACWNERDYVHIRVDGAVVANHVKIVALI